VDSDLLGWTSLEQLLADVSLPRNFENGFWEFARSQTSLQHYEVVCVGIVHPKLCDPFHLYIRQKQNGLLHKEAPKLSWWSSY